MYGTPSYTLYLNYKVYAKVHGDNVVISFAAHTSTDILCADGHFLGIVR
jgi:hypothetical protein